MLRSAGHHDLAAIQAVLNVPENLAKLEGYSNDQLLSAIDDLGVAIFV